MITYILGLMRDDRSQIAEEDSGSVTCCLSYDRSKIKKGGFSL